MRQAVQLARVAQQTLPAASTKAARLVLSLFFKAVLGIERIFHFESLKDVGLALLTGGKRVLRRETLGALLRAAVPAEVAAFRRRTEPQLPRRPVQEVSLDPHGLARFTAKFAIPKGFHTLRNKYMRLEKLTYSFCLKTRMLLSLVAGPGDQSLLATLQTLLQRLLPRLGGAELRLYLDAEAAKNHKGLLDLVENYPSTSFIVRTPRRPGYVADWEALPPEAFRSLQEPGPYKGAPPKQIHVAETRTLLQGPHGPASVRTIVVREANHKGKERWHALWVFHDSTSFPETLIRRYRQRQHHEQRYRVMARDCGLETAPSGYSKKSADPAHPDFCDNALGLFGWVVGLATNVLEGWSLRLPQRFVHAFPRTLRRWFFAVPALLYEGTDSLLVVLRPVRFRPLWMTLVERANRSPVRIPWFHNKRLLFSLEGKHPPLSPDVLSATPSEDLDVPC